MTVPMGAEVWSAPGLCPGAWRRWGIAAMLGVLVAGSVGTSVSVQAQSHRQVQSHRQAEALLRRGDLEEAESAFVGLFEAQGQPRALLGAARAASQQGRYRAARGHLQRALEYELGRRDERQAQELLEVVEAGLVRLRWTVSPVEAEVRIDGALPEVEAEGWVHLDPGTHRIVVTAPGRETVEEIADFDPAVREERDWRLVPVQQEVPLLRAEREPSRLPMVLTVSGVGLLALTGGFVAVLVNRAGELGACQDAIGAPGQHCLNEPRLLRQTRAWGVATALTGIAGAVALTAGLLQWRSSDDEEGEHAWACEFGLGLSCQRSF